MADNLEWTPTARQNDFLSVPDTVKEALYGGAAGGGKTDCLIIMPLARGWHQDPNYKGILFRRTYSDLDKEVILRSRKWFNAAGAKFDDQKKRWTFPSGAIEQYGHCEREQQIRDYDSTEYNLVRFDELTHFTEFMYIYMVATRMRSSSQLPAISRNGTNPGNIGHAWCRSRFVLPARQGYKLIKDPRTNEYRIFIPAFATDNEYLLKNNPNYLNQLKMLGESEYRAKALGDWWSYEGQVFKEWRAGHIPGEPENACHVIEPFDIPLWWPRVLAIDWGYTAATYAIWAALSPDKKVYIYREYEVREKPVSYWASEIAHLSEREKESIVLTTLCHSAWQRRDSPEHIAAQFQRYSGFTPISSDKDRVGGKVLIHDFLRWTEKPKIAVPQEGFNAEFAQEILRNHGLSAYKSYCDTFEEEEEPYPIPRLQIFSNCTRLIDTIPSCVYDEKNPEDVAEFPGDDPYDTFRYLLKGISHYEGKASTLFESRRKADEVVARFHQTQNVTAFYREMERVEAARPRTQSGVRGFHKRGARKAAFDYRVRAS